jgi:hypothetical protein
MGWRERGARERGWQREGRRGQRERKREGENTIIHSTPLSKPARTFVSNHPLHLLSEPAIPFLASLTLSEQPSHPIPCLPHSFGPTLPFHSYYEVGCKRRPGPPPAAAVVAAGAAAKPGTWMYSPTRHITARKSVPRMRRKSSWFLRLTGRYGAMRVHTPAGAPRVCDVIPAPVHKLCGLRRAILFKAPAFNESARQYVIIGRFILYYIRLVSFLVTFKGIDFIF